MAAYEPSSRPNRWNPDTLPGGTIFEKKEMVRRVLVALPRSRGVGVLCDEDREGKMGASDEEMMNSSLLRRCSWCRRFFLMPVDLLFGDISKYPHDT